MPKKRESMPSSEKVSDSVISEKKNRQSQRGCLFLSSTHLLIYSSIYLFIYSSIHLLLFILFFFIQANEVPRGFFGRQQRHTFLLGKIMLVVENPQI